ncbi:hypothetical protein M413DRAFT_388547 [Hebeloma cylindrosporum]|uniref:MARVEL domain-containing protein n=1 Tax=Hebeloma cylindrosporum TaxID=76867 RepID=A0A0C3CJ77_HEBCY|nr:hypothetical protein M413DRAFT_388547 [Hebeloma cylindrosporum h7]
MPSTQETYRDSSVFSSTETLQGAPQTRTVYILRCIPARMAVFSTAIPLLIFSSAFSSAGWKVLEHLDKYLTDIQKVAISFHMISCVFIWGASIVGIYAAGMNKKPGHPQLFAALLLGHILLGVASGAWCLQIIFATAHTGDRETTCAAMTGYWTLICRNQVLVKAFSLVAFLVIWIFEIAAIYAANRFAKQLREEDVGKSVSSPTNPEYA